MSSTYMLPRHHHTTTTNGYQRRSNDRISNSRRPRCAAVVAARYVVVGDADLGRSPVDDAVAVTRLSVTQQKRDRR
ncbi:hypothetical protein A2U01_0019326 [Trifolium medium]|uniref:Uncharacterized protein n=1 Tax=Trifolium medium TaxID=97028 RepID=A0A392NEM8_9FABA|nr:hypothetical protein [Trifolium medium]